MESFYVIDDRGESATVRCGLAEIREILAEDGRWGSKVLEAAGKGSFQVGYAKVYGSVGRLFGSGISEESADSFLARGFTGKNSWLLYRIKKIDEGKISVIPEGRIDAILKWMIPITLLFFCIIPVVLTPLAYKIRSAATRRHSTKHLEAFCRFLETAVSLGEPPHA